MLSARPAQGGLDILQQQKLPAAPQPTTTSSPPVDHQLNGGSSFSQWELMDQLMDQRSCFPGKWEELISMWANGHFTASLSILAQISHHALGFLPSTAQHVCVCHLRKPSILCGRSLVVALMAPIDRMRKAPLLRRAGGGAVYSHGSEPGASSGGRKTHTHTLGWQRERNDG